MNLSKAQEQHILDVLNDRWPSPRQCPACKEHGPWQLNSLGEIAGFKEASFLSVAVPVIPVIAVSCQKCTYIMLFNAIQLGIIDPKTGRFIDK